MRRALAAVLVVLLVAACGESPVPPQSPAIEFVLHLSATAAQPGETIEASARVANVGRVGVQHGVACIGGAVPVNVFNPDGTLFDDGLPDPACPDYCCETLEPGETASGSLRFDGRVFRYDRNPPQFTLAPPGIYTVVAAFDGVDRRAQFSWRLP